MSQDHSKLHLIGAALASTLALSVSEISAVNEGAEICERIRKPSKISGKNRDKIKAARKQRRKSN